MPKDYNIHKAKKRKKRKKREEKKKREKKNVFRPIYTNNQTNLTEFNIYQNLKLQNTEH